MDGNVYSRRKKVFHVSIIARFRLSFKWILKFERIKMEELINVKNIGGQVVVSSREVTRNFGKRHADVLRDIENLIKNVSTQNCVQYFIQSEYKDASGKTNKEYMLT